MHNLFLLRRAYLQKQALILGYQHDLQLQQEGGGQQGAPGLQPVHYMHQMQDFALQLNEAFMQYMGTLYTGVSPATKATQLAFAGNRMRVSSRVMLHVAVLKRHQE